MNVVNVTTLVYLQTKTGYVHLLANKNSKVLVQAILKEETLQIFKRNVLKALNIEIEHVSFTYRLCISHTHSSRDHFRLSIIYVDLDVVCYRHMYLSHNTIAVFSYL